MMRKTFVYILAVIVALGVGLAFMNLSSGNRSSATAATQPSSAAKIVNSDLIKALTIVGTVPQCSTIVPADQQVSGLAKPTLGFQASVAKKVRKTSDAISTLLNGTDAPAQLNSMLIKLCQDPELGYSWGNMLFNLKLGASKTTVGSLNTKWLQPANAKDINTLAQAALPYSGVQTSTLTDAQQKQAVQAWEGYEAFAAKLTTLVGKFHLIGDLNNPQSVMNWHLLNGGLTVGSFPAVGLNNHQENLPAVVLSVTEKGQQCELARIGANQMDSRPEVFAPAGCVIAVKPAPKPTVSVNTGCKVNCGGNTSTHPAPQPSVSTTHPSSTPTPTPTPTTPPKTCHSVYGPGYSGTYPNCHKDGSKSVQPTQPASATGTNPAPNPTNNPGSNKCYSETTGQPVTPNPDGTCPVGSFGG
jgi:hypothetical protein